MNTRFYHLLVGILTVVLVSAANINVAENDIDRRLLWVLAPVAALVLVWSLFRLVALTKPWWDNLVLAVIVAIAAISTYGWFKETDTDLPLEAMAWILVILACLWLHLLSPDRRTVIVERFRSMGNPRLTNPPDPDSIVVTTIDPA